MNGGIELSKLSDDQIRAEFFRRIQCSQYPEKNVILIGPPGTTKTAQGNRLAYELCSCLVSVQDILKNEVRGDTELGREIKDSIVEGRETSEDVVIKAINNKLKNPECRKGAIFDNFPQNVEQGKKLDDLLTSSGHKIDKVYNFEADEKALLSRINQRASQTEAQGGDLNASKDGLKSYFASYDQVTKPLVDYYQKRGLIKALNDDGDADSVWKGIGSTLFMD